MEKTGDDVMSGHREIRVTIVAEEEFTEIYNYIADRNSISVAEKIKRKVFRDIMLLSSFPNIGQVIRGNYRRLVVENFSIFYLVQDEKIIIAHILDGRQSLKRFN